MKLLMYLERPSARPRRRVKIAIIGTGKMARGFAAALAPKQ
jgi:hypothetical protein